MDRPSQPARPRLRAPPQPVAAHCSPRLLVAGRLHRRTRHKRAARDTLTVARDVFAELGARQFLDQTDQDLTRIGLRTPTPAGVAGQLFLSTKTVEANLTRIYRKLHLRSRADLANWHHDRLR